MRFSFKLTRFFSTTTVLKRMSSSVSKTLFTEATGDGTIALTMGAPAERHLEKVGKFLDMSAAHMQKIDWTKDMCHLQYGPMKGSLRYKEQVANFLAQGYGSPVKSDEIVVTAGATHGLHLVGTVLFENGYTAFVEDPTYFIAINILKGELGMNVVAVPTDNKGGVDPAVLEKLLQTHQAEHDIEVTEKKPFKSLIYLIPTYHNPLGHCMSADRCKAVVQLARKYDALIFCDDVYNLLHFDDATKHAPPRLVTYDDPSDPDYKGGNVLSNGTFSKIMAPGLRLGWIEARPRICNLLINNNITWSAGSPNQYTSEIVASALELQEEQKYLAELNNEYKENIAELYKMLEENLPEGCSFSQPKGGYFVWITMPEVASAAAVAKAAMEQHKIRVLNGAMCSATGSYTNCLRISFSHYPQDVLISSAKTVCDVIKQHLKQIK